MSKFGAPALALALCSLLNGAADASEHAGPRATGTPIVLASGPQNPEVPIFLDDGSAIIKGTDTSGPYPSSQIEWIRSNGSATLWKLPATLRGDVQSLYAAGDDLWLLFDDATVNHDGGPPPPRRYRFGRMSSRGTITRLASAARAPWPLQTDTSRSLGGIWTATGVYWTYNTFNLLVPYGLNWADLSGLYHQPWNSPVNLGGNPDDFLAVDGRGALWTGVTDRAGTNYETRLGADGIDRIDVSTAAPKVTKFSLSGEAWPTNITPDRDGGFWFSKLQGALGRILKNGAVKSYRWKAWDRHAQERGSARPDGIVEAPDRGVWAYDSTLARHFTSNGERGKFAIPELLRRAIPFDGPRAYEPSAVISACRVMWVRSAPDAHASRGTGALWSWRRSGNAKNACLDASRIRAPLIKTATLTGF